VTEVHDNQFADATDPEDALEVTDTTDSVSDAVEESAEARAADANDASLEVADDDGMAEPDRPQAIVAVAEGGSEDAAAPATENSQSQNSRRNPATDLVAEGDAAADYLEVLLDIADLDGDIDIDVENDRAAVAVVEVNAGELNHLVGPNGEVLRALQDLTRLAAARETGNRARLMLDIAGHRATRKAELQQIAAAAITEVKETQGPVRLAPMSAFERKVVHDVVADGGLASESAGAEPERYVVISPA